MNERTRTKWRIGGTYGSGIFIDWSKGGTPFVIHGGSSDEEGKQGGADRAKQMKGRTFDRQTKLLLAVSGLFAVANALSGAFVNVYLWKEKSDLAVIGWFALAHQLAMIITFYIAGKWVKEGNKMNSLRLGIALAACFYLLVLFLGRRAFSFVWLLGGVQGISSGLFWLAFNVVYFEVTNKANRDRFNGWAGLLGSGSGMVAPWLSGLLIAGLGGETGYRLVFSLSLGVFVTGVAVSFFLKKRMMHDPYEWTFGVSKLREHESVWKWIFPALVAQGVREGVFAFVIGLMVYMATKTEYQLGNYSLLTSAVAFVAFYITGRWLKPRHRVWSMLIGALAMVAVIVPFFWSVSYWALLVFGIGASLFFPLYGVPITSVVFDFIGSSDESAKHRVEYIVLREIALNLGRIFGTLVFILVVSLTASPLAFSWLLLGIGSSPLFSWAFLQVPLRKKSV